MAVFGLPDALAVVLLLLPGFILFRVFLHQAQIGATQSEFELTYWSVIGSVAALLLFSLLYRVGTGVDPAESLLSRLVGQPVPGSVIGWYLVVLLLAAALGLLIGGFYYYRWNVAHNLTRSSRSVWSHIDTNSQRPMAVDVVTDDGGHIMGKVKNFGSDNALLLRYPKRREPEDTTYTPAGKYVYLGSESFSHFYMLTGLLNEPMAPEPGYPINIDEHTREDHDDRSVVTGIVHNGGDRSLTYAEVRVRFLAADQTVLGTGYDSIREFDSNTNWRFTVEHEWADENWVAEARPVVSDFWTEPEATTRSGLLFKLFTR